MKYSELGTTIASWLDRSDLTEAQLDDFLCLTEAEIARKVKSSDMETVLTFTTSSTANSFTYLPYDCRQIKRITWDGKPLEQISDTEIAIRLKAASETEPAYFSTVGNELVFSAAIDADPANWDTGEELVITYFANGCVFDQHPDLYLKGMMFYANEFLLKEDEAMKWSTRFYSTLEDVKLEGKYAYSSGSTRSVRAAYGD